jgi:hypothetical protein
MPAAKSKKPAPLPIPVAPTLVSATGATLCVKLPTGYTPLKLESVSATMATTPFAQKYPGYTYDPATGLCSYKVPAADANSIIRVAATSTNAAGQVLRVVIDKTVVPAPTPTTPTSPVGVTPYADPHLFMGTEQVPVRPGDGVIGEGAFSTTAKLYATSSTGVKVLCPNVQTDRTDGISHAILPATAMLDRYELTVEDGTKAAPEKIILNQARGIQHELPQNVPGGVSRIYGRNLYIEGSPLPPQLFFQTASGTRYEAQVDLYQSAPEWLQYTLPANIPTGQVYSPFVRNGLGGIKGETLVEQPLLVLPAVAAALPIDRRILAVAPWAANVVSIDNTSIAPTPAADGTNATQELGTWLYKMSPVSGGPGGTIDCHGRTFHLDLHTTVGNRDVFCLHFYPKVALMNARFTYGYGEALGNFGYCFLMDCDDVGLINVSFKNINEQGKQRANMLAGSDDGKKNMFFVNVTGDIQGEPVTFNRVDNLLLDNFSVTNRYGAGLNFNGGPFTFLNCTNVLRLGGTWVHEYGYSAFQKVTNLVQRNGHIIRDAAINNQTPPIVGDTRNQSINGGTNVVYLDMLSETINGPAYDGDSGETLLAEYFGENKNRKNMEMGTLTSATATVLTDANANFGGRGPFSADAIVAITNGKGMRQWRKVISNTKTTLTVDRPFALVPDNTSVYTVTEWAARNWTIVNSKGLNNRAGVVVFQNATLDGLFKNVEQENGQAITLQPYQQEISNGSLPADNGKLLTPCWNIAMVDCTAKDTGNLHPGVPAYIGVYAKTYQTRPLGPLTANILVRTSHVKGKPGYQPIISPDANGKQMHFPYYDFRQSIGFVAITENLFIDPTYGEGNNNGVPQVMSVFFDRCEAISCASQYWLDNGSKAVTIYNPQGYANASLVADTAQRAATQTSQGTSIVKVLAS